MSKSIRKALHMQTGDTIVTAWCEYCCGPGWSNTPVWVILKDSNGKLRQECVQPDQFGKLLHCVWPVCESAHTLLLSALAEG